MPAKMDIWPGLCVLLALGAASTAARAADVALEVSTREAYVGESINVRITVANARKHDPPRFPELPGATVRGGRSGTNQSVNWINGRMTRQSTVTYSYTVTPKRPGQLVIPAIAVRADGRVFQTPLTTISVVASDMDDLELVAVELSSSRDSIYLGEALDVTLEIWVRRYRDRNLRMDAEQMLARIDFGAAELGLFHDTWVQLRDRRRGWQYREAVRPDAEGTPRSYYVYVLPLADLVPTRTGPLDVGDVSVVVSYPLRTEPERGLFGRPRRDLFTGQTVYTVSKARPVVAELGESPVTVKPVPAEGQPPLFNGAVGEFDFSVAAANTEVRVREPIEITLTVKGQGVLDRVPAPPLNMIEELTDGFRVPDSSPAGIVKGGRKRFTVRISAKTAEVTEIPAIPFVCFDPATERYVTRWSDPIPVSVTASQSVSLAQFADTDQDVPPGQTRLTETAVGIRANYADMDAVLAQQAFAPGWATVAVLAASPLGFVVCALIQRHRHRLRHDTGYLRRRRAYPNALAAIRSASQPGSHGEVAAAVIRYISDRCAAPAGLTRAEAVGILTDRGLAQRCVEETQRLLEHCEGLQYAGTNSQASADLADRARRCLADLERERF